MSYVNVGVLVNGDRAASKKALKDAISTDPSKVHFYSTSAMGTQFDGSPTNLTPGVKLSVVGPDPYTSRKWYATVELVNGKVKLS